MAFYPFWACAAAAALALVSPRHAGAEEPLPLVIMYPDMKPFIQQGEQPGKATGGLADWIEELAGEAHLHLTWSGPIPHARILADMESGKAACHPNARRTEERAQKFLFTEPIFPPSKWRVLTRPGSPVAQAHSTMELLQREDLKLGHLLGASLGTQLDEALAGRTSNVLQVRGSPVDLIRLLRADRVDYLIADITALPSLPEADIDDLLEIELPDLPSSEPGRIMCSASVPKTVVQRLNNAIHRIQNSRS